MKNSNGSGSVYKLKGKRRKPWVARITTGYSVEGKQLRKTVGTFETKREAQKALINFGENPMLYSGKTFKEVKDLWWESYKLKVAESTLETREFLLKNFESLEDMKISDIKLATLQNIFDNLDISWATKNNLRSSLNMIFNYALKYDFVSINKVSLIELGVNKKIIDRKVFKQKEIDTLWENVNFDDVSYAVLILIYTGMRISELFNLKNSDIDLEDMLLRITKSKTSSGVRTIPISKKIIHLFRLKVNSEEEYFMQGTFDNKENYPAFKYKFKKLSKDLGLEKHTIHDTRHTFATLLNNAEANENSITKLAGHRNSRSTQVYTHKDIEELRKAVEMIQ